MTFFKFSLHLCLWWLINTIVNIVFFVLIPAMKCPRLKLRLFCVKKCAFLQGSELFLV